MRIFDNVIGKEEAPFSLEMNLIKGEMAVRKLPWMAKEMLCSRWEHTSSRMYVEIYKAEEKSVTLSSGDYTTTLQEQTFPEYISALYDLFSIDHGLTINYQTTKMYDGSIAPYMCIAIYTFMGRDVKDIYKDFYKYHYLRVHLPHISVILNKKPVASFSSIGVYYEID